MRRGMVLGIVAMFVASVAGCTNSSVQPPGPGAEPGSESTAVLASECQPTRPRHGALPAPLNEFMASSASWIGDKHAAAVLFYAQSHDTTIGTKGTMGPGTNSKILWLVAGNPPGPLTVKGTNLSTGTQVRQSFSGSGDFPSIPVLPDPGCWQLTALIGSKIVLQMTVLAEDKTASTPTTQTPPERAGCIETKGVANVLSGPVQAGPFKANRHHWTRPGGTKFWVAATSPQGRRGATIRATHTGEKNTRVMVRRGPDDRAELPGDPNPPAEFYPGALRLPSAGTWRLTITIGSATDCFLVTVPRR